MDDLNFKCTDHSSPEKAKRNTLCDKFTNHLFRKSYGLMILVRTKSISHTGKQEG